LLASFGVGGRLALSGDVLGVELNAGVAGIAAPVVLALPPSHLFFTTKLAPALSLARLSALNVLTCFMASSLTLMRSSDRQHGRHH